MTPPRPRLVDVDLVVAQYLLGRTRLVQVLCPASRNLYFPSSSRLSIASSASLTSLSIRVYGIGRARLLALTG